MDLHLAENKSLSGDPLCPHCGATLSPGQNICVQCGFNLKTGLAPEVKVPRHVGRALRRADSERRKPSVLARLLAVLLLLAALPAVYFTYQHYFPPSGRVAESSVHYGDTLNSFIADIFKPLSQVAPVDLPIDKFAGTCAERVRSKGKDAPAAKLALQACNILRMANARRAFFEGKLRYYRAVPPSQLNNRPGEKARSQEFYVNTDVIQPWIAEATNFRADVSPLVERVVMMEREMNQANYLLQDIILGYRNLYQTLSTMAAKWIGQEDPKLQQPEFSLCATCRGAGKISCVTCGGFGSIEVKKSKNCEQCGGTGSYKSRMMTSASPCPFCRGTGSIEASVREPCGACQGNGWVACAPCGGSGKVSSVSENQSRGT